MISESDRARLAPSYTEAELELPHLQRVAARLGIHTATMTELAEVILGDLDEDDGGITWWSDVPQRQAILIADHAYQAAAAPLGLLLEARLHLSALEQIWHAQEGRWIEAARRNGRLTVPESTSPLDDLDTNEEHLHLTGFFRCVAQVLDCLAATCIAVFDLPANLPKASWPALDDGALERLRPTSPGSVEAMERIVQAERGAGPSDWSAWAVAMRHLLVHRPRLLGFNQIYGSGDGLYVAGGGNAGNLRLCRYLPREPQKAWIESLLPDGPAAAYIAEHGGLTLSRLLRSVSLFTESVASELLGHWKGRAVAHVSQASWAKQWPDSKAKAIVFKGYAPASRPFGGDRVVVSPVDGRRMTAAQLDDSVRRGVWGTDPN